MIFLLLLSPDQVNTALAFNGPPYDGSHLGDGVQVAPRAVSAPSPYAYAGQSVLPTSLLQNTDYAVMWDFLGTLETVEIDPNEAWPDPGGLL